MFNQLPQDIQKEILKSLKKTDLQASRLVCNFWNQLILNSPEVRKNLVSNSLLEMAYLFKDTKTPCTARIAIIGHQGNGVSTLCKRLITGEFAETIQKKLHAHSEFVALTNKAQIRLTSYDFNLLSNSLHFQKDLLGIFDLILFCINITTAQDFEIFLNKNTVISFLRRHTKAPILIVGTYADLQEDSLRQQISEQHVIQKLESNLRNQLARIKETRRKQSRGYFLSQQIYLQRPIPTEPELSDSAKANVIGFVHVSSKTGVGIPTLLTKIKDHAVVPVVREAEEKAQEQVSKGSGNCNVM